MTNKEAIEQLKWVKKRISNITYSPESFEAINLAIEALTQMDSCPVFSDDEVKQPCIESPCSKSNEVEDLCETCRYGDTCDQSDKGVSFAKHSKCWKYEKEGGRQ